ncbi:MAG: Flp family type IVb pilin [Planctomycetota bacterium]
MTYITPDKCRMERSPNRKVNSAKSLCKGNTVSAARVFLRRLFREEQGPTAVEYAVMLALIVIACLASVQALSTETAASFDSSSAAIEEAISG